MALTTGRASNLQETERVIAAMLAEAFERARESLVRETPPRLHTHLTCALSVDVMKRLFLDGPTWDGAISAMDGWDGHEELRRLGFLQHEFGWSWLTRDGIKFALESLQIGEDLKRREP